jgi:predicted permease
MNIVDGVFRDLGLAARRLLATPLFLIFAVASISIGIATTTAAYAVLYQLLWKPLGIGQQEEVVVVGARLITSSSVNWRSPASIDDFEAIEARQQSLDDLSAVFYIPANLTTPSSSEVSGFEAVSGRFFRTVRVQATRGRMIQPEDDARQAQVLVLTDRTWRTKFASDPEVVGKTVRIAGRPFEVIGVVPDSFEGMTLQMLPVAGWVPMSTAPVLEPRFLSGGAHRAIPRLAILGRMREGGTLAAAASEFETIGNSRDLEDPTRGRTMPNDAWLRSPRKWTLRHIATADESPEQFKVGLLLLTLVGLVLVVACTNLGNLTLSRGAYRQHELAVRRALGASRGRLVRELFSETLLIALLASVCTVLLTRSLLVLATLDISTPFGAFSFAPRFNAPAAAISVAALAFSMLVFGLEPAFALTGRRASASLAEGVSTFGAGKHTRQRVFIRWQVAISVCFFLMAATIVRSIGSLALHDPGIAISELAIASVGTSPHTTEEQVRRALDRAAELARQRPDLTSVAIANGMPFGVSAPSAWLSTPGAQSTTAPPVATRTISASPEFFRTLGIPILRGRQFDHRDSTTTAHVVVVSEWTATRLFGSLDAAIGKAIALRLAGRATAERFTVIGVARQTDVGRLKYREDHLVFVPLQEGVSRSYVLVARTDGNPAGAARVLQDALRSADPDVGTGMSGPAAWVVATPVVIGRFAAALAGSLSLLTLTLAMIGLYGVQVQAVAFRTREMGVRMALGAAAAQIKRMVLRQGIRPVFEGIVLGGFFGVATRGVIKWSMRDPTIQIIDPTVFAVVPIPFAIAALIACYLPARRAARVDPNVALRHL